MKISIMVRDTGSLYGGYNNMRVAEAAKTRIKELLPEAKLEFFKDHGQNGSERFKHLSDAELKKQWSVNSLL